MKHLLLIIINISLIVKASASFSEHVILTPKSENKHSGYQPKLTVNPNNENLIDIEIPFNKSKSYWIITSSEKLKNAELDFRWSIWKNKHSNKLLLISRIYSTYKKDSKSIAFTIHKTQLENTYIYYDYPSIVKDGGYYYTYDLSKYSAKK